MVWAFVKMHQRDDERALAAMARVSEIRLSEFNAKDIANAAWAFAAASQLDQFAELARAAERCIVDFNSEEIVNMSWAFATSNELDTELFAMLGRRAEQHMSNFGDKCLANVALAFTFAALPAPSILEPMSMLDAVGSQTTMPQMMYYQIVMQCLASKGQIVAGFALLERMEANGLTSDADQSCYAIFRMLLEACRVGSDSEGASRVQVMLRCFSSIEFHPAASTR
eukprot:gnl/TRDRNA2_/TRDRNA2_170548_c2_seq5.p1 gnl/TRDRNA2_/TRDRNA2_170548_c2~~gnl/TRDRNA2_/TRDRNA2_170548_c2_seq5.p1  ORF type:complete len:226 (+),score=43.95 gnl/TRDRNA2_/TRDRNA2_170548_c2_seq5:122-799(+)